MVSHESSIFSVAWPELRALRDGPVHLVHQQLNRLMRPASSPASLWKMIEMLLRSTLPSRTVLRHLYHSLVFDQSLVMVILPGLCLPGRVWSVASSPSLYSTMSLSDSKPSTLFTPAIITPSISSENRLERLKSPCVFVVPFSLSRPYVTAMRSSSQCPSRGRSNAIT